MNKFEIIENNESKILLDYGLDSKNYYIGSIYPDKIGVTVVIYDSNSHYFLTDAFLTDDELNEL